MSKISRLVLIGALLLTVPLSVMAQQRWITYAKVKKIVVVHNGGINVRLEPELTGCVSQSGYGDRYASVYPDHPGLEKIHSIFLAAYAADKPVAVWLSDSTCRVGEVELGGRID